LVREGSFDTWVTGWELESAIDEISLAHIVDGYVWMPAADATNPLAQYVDRMFALKQATPKSDPRYGTYKLLLNALYGKLIQISTHANHATGEEESAAGSLFNPFWAAQITGHCRAHLHDLEHRYSALHSSTDSIITRARDAVTGSGLGDLTEEGRGRWLVIRPRLHFLADYFGTVVKLARHGFRGKTANDLLAWVLRGGGAYEAEQMIRPRQAARTRKKPFRMTVLKYHLDVPSDLVRRVAEQWTSRQAERPIPLPLASKGANEPSTRVGQ
jgi:hypothetical protein